MKVYKTMEKVRAAGVDVMTFGQYMRPTKKHMPVSEFVTPEAFDKWQEIGEEMVSVFYHPVHSLHHLDFMCAFGTIYLRVSDMWQQGQW